MSLLNSNFVRIWHDLKLLLINLWIFSINSEYYQKKSNTKNTTNIFNKAYNHLRNEPISFDKEIEPSIKKANKEFIISGGKLMFSLLNYQNLFYNYY